MDLNTSQDEGPGPVSPGILGSLEAYSSFMRPSGPSYSGDAGCAARFSMVTPDGEGEMCLH